MAYTPRTIEEIQAQIIASKEAESSLSGLNSTSQVAYWKLWTYITAVAINLLEQIMSIFFGEIETIVSQSVPGTAPWIQNEVKKFQYGDAVMLNEDFTIGYESVDTTKQIVSNCAVVVSGSGVINIKVATGTPPGPLSTAQATALNSYIEEVLPAGANFQLINKDADTLQINADVYYNGQYNSAIQADVIAALTAYMSSLPFNGIVKVSDIEEVILAVTGVVDVVFSQITATPDGGTPVNLVLAKTLNSRDYTTYSGYIVEAGSPNDFASTLNFIVAAQ